MGKTETTPEIDEPFDRFRRRVFSESVNTVEMSTAPIAYFKDGAMTLDRTGVLLAIGSHHFVVTAGHDLRALSQHGYDPIVLAPSPTEPPVPLLIDRFLVSRDETIDIGIYPLHNTPAANLKKSYRFLRLNDLRTTAPTDREGPYFLLTGFPIGQQTTDQDGRRRVDVCRYLTVRYGGDYSAVELFRPSSHIVLECSRDSEHASGYVGAPPHAHGMSGCGIWYVPIPNGIDAWAKADVRLVGIQTAWCRHEYYKGTAINHALSMIREWFPEVRSAMDLHGAMDTMC